MITKSHQAPLLYEPKASGHHEAARRRKEVQEWLKRREWELDVAPIVADVQPTHRERPKQG